jgi:hypothetical protein
MEVHFKQVVPQKRIVEGILWHGNCHHRNFESLVKDCKEQNILFKPLKDHLDEAKKEYSKFNVIWFFSSFEDPMQFPKSKFILFGPHNFVFPEGNLAYDPNKAWIYNMWKTRARFVVPSAWVETSYNETIDAKGSGKIAIPTCVLPFTVPLKELQPRPPELKDPRPNKFFLYIKHRHPSDEKVLTDFLQQRFSNDFKTNCRIFRYGSYQHQDYIQYVRNCNFGVWLGRHESQGFALLDCLSANVPLFIWDAKSMHQEFSNNKFTYEKKKPLQLAATTVPYFDDKSCGVTFYEEKEIQPKFEAFWTSLRNKQWKPREFIEKNFSSKIFFERFDQVLKEIIKEKDSK